MVISDAEKKVLLERLEKARLVKQAKAAEAKRAKEAPAPAPAPVPAPEPVPEPPAVVEEKPPASEPIDIPAPPDLVKASRKPAKKVCLPVDSDSEEEEVVMPKKTKGKAVAKKEVPYMKIKLYKEPSNPVAFQQMLESINDPQYEEEEEQAPPPPAPFVKGARVLQKVGIAPKRGVSSSLTPEDIKAAELKRLALEIFG
jgi:hypothetical protein